MDSVPQFQSIRAMHPADLTNSRDKLYMFLSGWMGGPDLFVEKFGHPRLRGRGCRPNHPRCCRRHFPARCACRSR